MSANSLSQKITDKLCLIICNKFQHFHDMKFDFHKYIRLTPLCTKPTTVLQNLFWQVR